MSRRTRRGFLATLGAASLGTAGVADVAAGAGPRRDRAEESTRMGNDAYEVEWTTPVARKEDVRIADVAPDHDRGCVLAGTVRHTGDRGAWMARVDGEGTVQWTNAEYGVLSSAASIVPGSDGGYVVAGTVEEGGDVVGRLVKFDDGDPGWHRTFRADGDPVYLSTVDKAGDGYAVAGTVGSADRGGIVMAKTGTEGQTSGEGGELRWEMRIDGPQQVVTDVVGTSIDDVIAVGYGEDGSTTYGAATRRGSRGVMKFADRFTVGEATRLSGVVSVGPTDHRFVGTATVGGRDRGVVLSVEGHGDVADTWTFGDDHPLCLEDAVSVIDGYVLVGDRTVGGDESDGGHSRGILLGVDDEGGVRWRRRATEDGGVRTWVAAASATGGRTVLGGLTRNGFDGCAALLEDPPRRDPIRISDVNPLAGYDSDTLALAGFGIAADGLALGGAWYAYRRYWRDDGTDGDD